jgi:hypothetical protein
MEIKSIAQKQEEMIKEQEAKANPVAATEKAEEANPVVETPKATETPKAPETVQDVELTEEDKKILAELDAEYKGTVTPVKTEEAGKDKVTTADTKVDERIAKYESLMNNPVFKKLAEYGEANEYNYEKLFVNVNTGIDIDKMDGATLTKEYYKKLEVSDEDIQTEIEDFNKLTPGKKAERVNELKAKMKASQPKTTTGWDDVLGKEHKAITESKAAQQQEYAQVSKATISHISDKISEAKYYRRVPITEEMKKATYPVFGDNLTMQEIAERCSKPYRDKDGKLKFDTATGIESAMKLTMFDAIIKAEKKTAAENALKKRLRLNKDNAIGGAGASASTDEVEAQKEKMGLKVRQLPKINAA